MMDTLFPHKFIIQKVFSCICVLYIERSVWSNHRGFSVSEYQQIWAISIGVSLEYLQDAQKESRIIVTEKFVLPMKKTNKFWGSIEFFLIRWSFIYSVISSNFAHFTSLDNSNITAVPRKWFCSQSCLAPIGVC